MIQPKVKYLLPSLPHNVSGLCAPMTCLPKLKAPTWHLTSRHLIKILNTLFPWLLLLLSTHTRPLSSSLHHIELSFQHVISAKDQCMRPITLSLGMECNPCQSLVHCLRQCQLLHSCIIYRFPAPEGKGICKLPNFIFNNWMWPLDTMMNCRMTYDIAWLALNTLSPSSSFRQWVTSIKNGNKKTNW